jgi:cytochrome P450
MGPGVRIAEPPGFAISRYGDAVAVLRDPAAFSSNVMARADPTLLGADPPNHARTRSAVSRALSAELRGGLERDIAATADRLVGEMATRSRCDLMADVAGPLPLAAIARILGIDGIHAPDLARWSSAVVAAGTGTSPETGVEIDEGLQEFDAFLRGRIDAAATHPGDDFMSRLLTGDRDRAPLTKQEVLSVVRLLVVAGTETTTHLIGNAVIALLSHPGLLRQLVTSPDVVPEFIEEILRFDSPVQYVLRTTTRPVELATTQIASDALVVVLLSAANRDETRYADSDRFQVRRRRRAHLAFGAGPHYCLGATLARLEAECVVRALLEATPAMEPAEDLARVGRVTTPQLRGPTRLIVHPKR